MDEGNDLPDRPGELPEAQPPAAQPTPISAAQPAAVGLGNKVRSAVNKFGLSRAYHLPPRRVPDADACLKDMLDSTADAPPTKRAIRPIKDIIHPYPNITSFLFNRYFRRPGREVSKSDRKKLQELLVDPRFDAMDLNGVNFDALDKEVAQDPQNPWDSTGWNSSPLVIEVPSGVKPTRAAQLDAQRERQRQRRHGELDLDASDVFRHEIKIFDVNHRSLLHILQEGVSEHSTATQLHFDGFEETWTPPYPHFPPELVYGEAYQSSVFLEAERALLESPPEPGCNLPRAILAYMFWSDATHLAQFGNAKAWPIYAILANLSKYTRCKPSERSAQYVAFVPEVRSATAQLLFRTYHARIRSVTISQTSYEREVSRSLRPSLRIASARLFTAFGG